MKYEEINGKIYIKNDVEAYYKPLGQYHDLKNSEVEEDIKSKIKWVDKKIIHEEE